MKLYKKILTLAVAVLPLAAFAEVNVTFETDDYAAVGVYDWWEASPFRTGVLKGNCKVVDNPFLADESAGNTTAKVLGFQRSRHGSNMFGARIDLKEDQRFVLTPTAQYVHVMMYKPVESRSMIIGLGRHNEKTAGYEETWKNQSPEAVQFTALANSKAPVGQWADVVFPVKGAGNIDIYSLVVVVDCESAHNRTEDFVAYIDDVTVNGSSAPRVALVGDYPVCVERTQQFTRTDRAFTQVTLKSTAGQYVKKQTKKNVLTEAFDTFIPVQSGETFTVKAGYTGNGMHSFVYIDLNNNGKFDESELVASDTKSGSGSRTTHSITLPADLASGIYRLRTKVDWQSTDPAGNSSADNHILQNGGGMIDVLLNVYSPERTTVSVSNFQRNGVVVLEDGTKIDNYAHPQFTELKVKAVPEKGFDYEGIRITHGYNFSGDSLVHSNPQYITYAVPRKRFAEDDTYTIPASYFDADVLIEGLMVEEGKEPVVDPTLGENISDLAQLDNGKAYAIHSINGEGYLCYNEDINGDYVGLTGVTDYHWNKLTSDPAAAEVYLADYNPAEAKGQWQIVLFEDSYYLYNLGAHKFVTRSGRDYYFSDDTPALDGIRNNGDGSFSFHAGGGMSDSSQSWACIVTNESTYALRNWTWNDHGSLFYITEIEDLTTYEGLVKLGGEDPTVGVGTVIRQQTTDNGQVFNLQGLRIDATRPERGIRIASGKKVLR